jgi:hypothetical protein
MLDDGEVERRVRLLRPMERIAIPLARMAQTHWQEADQAEFARAWEAEIATVPEFTDSELHIDERQPLGDQALEFDRADFRAILLLLAALLRRYVVVEFALHPIGGAKRGRVGAPNISNKARSARVVRKIDLSAYRGCRRAHQPLY